MTPTDFNFILNKPDAINHRQTASLEKIVDEFPFFQSARALRLKGLYNEDSFKYNYALKVTAAHTADRSVLFDFITSDSFTSIQKGLYDEKVAALHNIAVSESEIVHPVSKPVPNSLEQSIISSIEESAPETSISTNDTPEIISPKEIIDTVDIEKTAESTRDALEIGKPLEFEKSEKHSFEEWLQLAKLSPISRDNPATESDTKSEPTESEPIVDHVKLKKNELIERFIQTNPKIPPVRSDQPTQVIIPASESDNTYLMTETLARVYLEQKKYSKAIQAYEILILKYPEKSSFFADRILDIKHLQQNNNSK